MTTTSIPQPDLIPKSTAEKLDAHAKLIKTFIAGQRKGAGELFGYAFLAGCQLLQAKTDVPNGNSAAPNAGFKNWVETTFPDVGMRTAERWMVFAEDVRAAVGDASPKAPLLLGAGKLNVKRRNLILDLVSRVMDGKSMTQFMRDCRLLRDPEKAKPVARPARTRQEANKARAEQARRVCKGVCGDYNTAAKVLRWTPAEDLKQLLDRTVDFGNAIREQLKKLKVEPNAVH